ncbi:rna-directed dna polymerase from mobile element jockey-like protein [Lasius niger]|uniref:Rna-directed dna polymerase from mobile element jockey-like protein n=1 Tax=Lasius niger TaxID=67767 RepID=A0A0J7NN95_LASNI|nr:rna-directed dna polymerase from mobile element jockey-like protein [Lasius niger]
MLENNLHPITTGEPTYWPTDRRKKPDVIDFCIVKGISVYQFKAESSFDLTSDHTPILITLNAIISKKDKPLTLCNAKTDWNLFKDSLNNQITCKIQLKTREEIETAIDIYHHHSKGCLGIYPRGAKLREHNALPNKY